MTEMHVDDVVAQRKGVESSCGEKNRGGILGQVMLEMGVKAEQKLAKTE